MLTLTNSARRNNGLRALELNWRLSKDALQHSRRMAERGTVYHTANLYRLVRRWHPSVWGENVGMAGTVRRVHKLFMASSSHRGNILRNGYAPRRDRRGAQGRPNLGHRDVLRRLTLRRREALQARFSRSTNGSAATPP